MLREYKPTAVRFLFLLHKYHEPMEYSTNSMAAAADLERRFATFSTRCADVTVTAHAAATAPTLDPLDPS